MIRKLVSWGLVGAFAYLWMWVGYRWPYLNSTGNQWSGVFILFSLASLVVLLRSARVGGTGMFDRVVGSVRGFLPTLPWLVLAVVVARVIAWVHIDIGDPVDHFSHAIVTALSAGITSALLYGAIANADDS